MEKGSAPIWGGYPVAHQHPYPTVEQAPAAAQPPKPKMTTLDKFADALEQFLVALTTVWDDDRVIARKLQEFREIAKHEEFLKEKLIRRWHKDFSPYYDACRTRDVATVLNANISYLQQFSIREKFAEIRDDLESQENIWVYINELNKYAFLFCGTPQGLPPKIMRNIQDTTLNMLTEFENGKTWKDYDIVKVGLAVLEGATEEENADLVTNFGSIIESVGGVEAMERAKEEMGTDVDMGKFFDMIKGLGVGETTGKQPTMEEVTEWMRSAGIDDNTAMEKMQEMMSMQSMASTPSTPGIQGFMTQKAARPPPENVQRDRYKHGWQPTS